MASLKRTRANQMNTIKRQEQALSKRSRNGENAKNSKAFAKIMDNLYGTDFVQTHHSSTK